MNRNDAVLSSLIAVALLAQLTLTTAAAESSGSLVPLAPVTAAPAADKTTPAVAPPAVTAPSPVPGDGVVDTHGAGWQTMLDQYAREREIQLAKPAPFGRYGDGTPVAAPAYDAMRGLWKAAIRDPNSGLTINALGALMQDPQRTEDALRALAQSSWGREWLSHDENAALIGRTYGLQLLGYWVTRKSFNPDDGYIHLTH